MSEIPESISDERLKQMAFDPAVCNLSAEAISALRETVQLRAKIIEMQQRAETAERVASVLRDKVNQIETDLELFKHSQQKGWAQVQRLTEALRLYRKDHAKSKLLCEESSVDYRCDICKQADAALTQPAQPKETT